MTKMITVYDLREDETEVRRIQEIVHRGKTRYRSKWGLFGTEDWWANLNSEKLILNLNGTISRLFMSGHNDFPEFEITCGDQKYSFGRIGHDKYYGLGKRVNVECIESQYIQASDIAPKVLHILALEIEP